MSHWTTFAGVAVLITLVGCNDAGRKTTAPPTGTPNPTGGAVAAQASDQDRQIEAILAGKDEDGDKAVPTDEFFAKLGQGYMIWKGEAEWFKKLADEAKAAGSPAVYAVVGEAFGTTHVCASYIIAMPTEAAARPKVIEAYNNFWKRGLEGLDEEERETVAEDIQDELVQDHGQKYLMLSYDP